jgi:hypothetical protein
VSVRVDALSVDSDVRAWELTTPGAPLGATSGGSQARAPDSTNIHQQQSALSAQTASERAGCVVPQGCEPAQPAGPAGGPVATSSKVLHSRVAQPSRSRQYKDKSPRALADQREGSPEGAQLAATRRARRQQIREAPKAVLPKHVQNCINRNPRSPWAFYWWKRDNPKVKHRCAYRCGSWRCEGECARHEASVTFARIRDACAPFAAGDFVFLVLTLDRDGYYSQKPWLNADEAYRALSGMTARFLKRLRRWMVTHGMKPIGSEWVAVVEAHRSGWPHMNLLVHSPDLARELTDRIAQRAIAGMSKRERTLLQGELLAMATATGWGAQSTAEPVRDKGAVTGYITKLAGLAGAAGAEVAKITQVPLSAPRRFRRLRSGTNFLPERRESSENVTGTLIRRTADVDGTPLALPLHKAGASDREHVADCCYQEEALMIEEERFGAPRVAGLTRSSRTTGR